MKTKGWLNCCHARGSNLQHTPCTMHHSHIDHVVFAVQRAAAPFVSLIFSVLHGSHGRRTAMHRVEQLRLSKTKTGLGSP